MSASTRSRIAAVAAALLVGPAGAIAAETAPAPEGEFSQPFAEDPTFDKRPPQTYEEAKRVPPAVHMAMMPDGRVAYWGGLESIEDLNGPAPLDGGRAIKPASSRILDLRFGTPSWSSPGNNTGGPRENEDLFCADQRLLPDGRLLAVGGTVWDSDPVDLGAVTGGGGPGGTLEVFGTDATRWLDFRHERPSWTGGDRNRMHRGRWYPTAVTLADGRVLVASGVARLIYNAPGVERGDASNVRTVETYDPRTDGWTRAPASAEVSLPLYPRLHLTHDGKLLYPGAGMMWSPFGQAPDEALWNLHQVYDPERHRWTMLGVAAFGARSDPFSVPLMLSAPYDKTRILIAGGTLGTSPSAYLATALSEIVTYRHGTASTERTGDLNNRRWFSSGVLLPDGQVLALAGGDKNANVVLGSDAAVRQVELFDPEAKRWTPLASAKRERTYHSAALLLPDGRVLLGGHSPQQVGGPDHPPTKAGVAAPNLKDPSFEVFTPPYLHPSRGPRPKIAFARAQMDYARPGAPGFRVDVAGDVSKVVLMRLPSTTHVTDSDQRGIELDVERTRSDGLRVTPPPSGKVAPPGYYYLFALSPSGVPSKARIVHVGPGQVAGVAPAPFGE
jgi:hypothetical protein